ncbi:hypothetical protein PHYBLDRAFT_62226 [Phycomyces blakesleeanus NRRL 1555(-)]|uniref:DDE Tnp4 domain-containing protein n=1 Tax=Phycomyces blakesleeanus (strain ATCC 8743b / DSM 1359 / FGSC 10004 / NBRC 33097 / NRRL 1555) TaxID=763407 RepID=A0A162Y8N2_PHYB8|nr:hypothetical protein PHYBLDRAFT_62226 [Phycomyces blakesleeanus NRRL 1555(-)]OAD79005.1 hypothetical protein PHYBLDRAFT_62226 [Phycomyces blakesleeanus NRRL 1555(-)]|eukprot:XP_018297045.1 hypothetical protein PHYBLDRAFT_62226 [Phycomyces blakesleeanus NRRL 1555(-)]
MLLNVIGFIDETRQAIAQPSEPKEIKKTFYNGWKHIHAIKFQDIVTHDRITSSILGPYFGAKYDQYVNSVSKTEERLEKYLKSASISEASYALYGVPAYMEAACNKSMFKVRVAAEWEFGEIQKYFKFCKYKYAMKI